MREPRTDIDWSKHKIIESFSDNCKIWSFEKPNTIFHAVHFINAKGVMSVTGDFGNWIFCREFHPSKDGYVSDSYWCEKLRIASKQDAKVYNADKTEKAIKNYILNEIWDCYGEEKPAGFDDSFNDCVDALFFEDDFNETGVEIESECLKKEIFWLVDCLNKTQEGEDRYLCFSHDELPENCDHESVIVHYDLDPWLDAVFDAFDQICLRMGSKS